MARKSTKQTAPQTEAAPPTDEAPDQADAKYTGGHPSPAVRARVAREWPEHLPIYHTAGRYFVLGELAELAGAEELDAIGSMRVARLAREKGRRVVMVNPD